MDSFINETSIQELVKGYKFANPFPFTYIDNFLKSEKLDMILDEVNELKSENADSKFVNSRSPTEFNKFAFSFNFEKSLQSLFEELVSNEFIDVVEKCTGIYGLIRNDTQLFGAGVHRIHKDGYLGIHTDFNVYYNEKYGLLDRRINLLIYLNPDWTDEYDGTLWLCNHKHETINYKILPILNRCVMFNTSSVSLHGHPTKLKCPDDRFRQSIAVYYYTKNANNQPNMNNKILWNGNNDVRDYEGHKYRGTVFYDTKCYEDSYFRHV
jgi:Rps23 Pro-64 3,4-dihydroxylase Tpa1-like proline 4-hydroxylase